MKLITTIILLISTLTAGSAGAPHLEGGDLSILWVVPFVGILLSIAIFPLVASDFWHHNFGKISAFWATLFILPFMFSQGWQITLYEVLHVGLLEYIPFIILLLALFTISGGVQLTGSLVGTPIINTAIILVGTLLASWMGTTGAAMLLIRPLLRANKERKYKVHIVVFFIFLVANIGGSLTPLGDPPLFLGFLKGVDFFWTTKAMFLPMLFMVISLLIIFYIYDTIQFKKEDPLPQLSSKEKIGIKGSFNLLLIFGVVCSVLLSGFWKPHIEFTIYHVHVELQNIIRDILLLLLAYASWKYTTTKIREANEYTWFPIQEVAKLFAGIFITIIPAIAILKAGTKGALKGIINSVQIKTPKMEDGVQVIVDGVKQYDIEHINYMYFWITGILSSFLDNAPTYLVFFNAAGGNADMLMGDLSQTLLAISAGAVFMGANTYIGNAPNFMVKSIAESSGVEMPSFFGFFLYSLIILFPLYGIVSFLFF